MKGTNIDLLAGLCCYIDGLIKTKISKQTIKKVINMCLNDDKGKRVETKIDDDKIKVQKFDLNGLTDEEVKEILNKELFEMFD